MTQPRKGGLGRGLDALIRPAPEPTAAGDSTSRITAAELDIDLISPNPEQPRTHFEPEKLRELADSIREHGILQPLVVSRTPSGGFRLIAGERRLQAARLAGLAVVPVVFREADDKDLLELALVENIQRADLNPIEEALAYRRLLDEHGLTQEAAAKKVGKSRPAVANSLRLLGLEQEIRRSLISGEISEGHARALLAIEDGKARLETWRLVVRRQLSVRETEALARKVASGEPARPSKPSSTSGRRSGQFRDLETNLRRRLGTRVTVAPHGEGAKITIDCFSGEELDGVINTILGGQA